jgi:hypothetical protein
MIKPNTSGEMTKGYRVACDAIERVADTYGLEQCALVGPRTREHLRRAQAEAIWRARGHGASWSDISEAICITEAGCQALAIEYPSPAAASPQLKAPPGLSKQWTQHSIEVALAAASKKAKEGV